MNAGYYFSANHGESRARFRRAARAAGVEADSYTHPDPGPAGESLLADVAWFGPRDAERVLILNSGTHGVEGLCGTGCIAAWMGEQVQDALKQGIAVLVVHLLNPYGTAWQRRQCEGNVDLNRNCVDHAAGRYPPNPLYDAIHPHLVPRRMTGPERDAADRALSELRERHGARAYSEAILIGQYTQPHGLFHGGRQPVWSNRLFRQLVAERCSSARALAFVEYHTGIGPFGYGMLVTMHPPRSAALARAQHWYGRSLCASLANIERGAVAEDMPIATGFLAGTLEEVLPRAAITSIALEYGTFPLDEMLALFREDAWLHAYGDPLSEEGRRIRQRVEDFFYPRSEDWCEMVIARSRQVIAQAVRGLAQQA